MCTFLLQNGCIVGYGTGALWDLCDKSVESQGLQGSIISIVHHWGDIPQWHDMPQWGDMSQEGDMPRLGDMPQWGDMPQLGDMPQWGDMPQKGWHAPVGWHAPFRFALIGYNTVCLLNNENPIVQLL